MAASIERRPNTTITLSRERAEQLRMISAAHYLSITELFARFIYSEIQKGTIPDEIPGYRIKRVGRHVEICIDGATLMTTVGEARKLADVIEQIASDPYFFARTQLSTRRTFSTRYGTTWIQTSQNDFIDIRRRGRGLTIEINKHKKKPTVRRSLSPDVALDLCRLIRSSAKKAALSDNARRKPPLLRHR